MRHGQDKMLQSLGVWGKVSCDAGLAVITRVRPAQRALLFIGICVHKPSSAVGLLLFVSDFKSVTHNVAARIHSCACCKQVCGYRLGSAWTVVTAKFDTKH